MDCSQQVVYDRMCLRALVLSSLLALGSAFFFSSNWWWPTSRVETSLPKSCGKHIVTPTARIVGGIDAEPHEWPWTVNLRTASNTIFCGGSIITQRHILTSAHCVKPYRWFAFLMHVAVGAYSIKDGMIYYVYSLSFHPEYGQGAPFHADAAIVTLIKDITFDARAAPVCLPPPHWTPNDQLTTIVGWGLVEESGSLPEVLQQVSVKLLKNDVCKNYFEKDWSHEEAMLCCEGTKKDACQGDSGGPMLVQLIDGRWVQVGIVSYGSGCARHGVPAVYARVTYFLEFIKGVVTS